METLVITSDKLNAFKAYLIEDEKSDATLEKYMRDVRAFAEYVGNRAIEKSDVLSYKVQIGAQYAVSSANSMIAAINSFLRFFGFNALCVKQFKVQKDAYCSDKKELTKSEYQALVNEARKNKNERLSLVIQTICATGIRISELSYITVEGARRGEVDVFCKGKRRRVFIVSSLRKKLLRYASKNQITSGTIFITRSGKPISRSNVWRDMKSLCEGSGIPPEKVFPHNLRHLFARTFYGLEKDIAKLADILGHSNINTTRIYIMSTGSEHRRRIEMMRLIT